MRDWLTSIGVPSVRGHVLAQAEGADNDRFVLVILETGSLQGTYNLILYHVFFRKDIF